MEKNKSGDNKIDFIDSIAKEITQQNKKNPKPGERPRIVSSQDLTLANDDGKAEWAEAFKKQITHYNNNPDDYSINKASLNKLLERNPKMIAALQSQAQLPEKDKTSDFPTVALHQAPKPFDHSEISLEKNIKEFYGDPFYKNVVLHYSKKESEKAQAKDEVIWDRIYNAQEELKKAKSYPATKATITGKEQQLAEANKLSASDTNEDDRVKSLFKSKNLDTQDKLVILHNMIENHDSCSEIAIKQLKDDKQITSDDLNEFILAAEDDNGVNDRYITVNKISAKLPKSKLIPNHLHRPLNSKTDNNVKDGKSEEGVGQNGLVEELRDFAAQMGISPQGNTEEFRDLVVDYIQKKAVGVFDVSSSNATSLLNSTKASGEYQSMLEESFAAFEFNDEESKDMLQFASTTNKLKELDEQYFRQSEEFRVVQQEYRGQGGNSTSEKAAGFYKTLRMVEVPEEDRDRLVDGGFKPTEATLLRLKKSHGIKAEESIELVIEKANSDTTHSDNETGKTADKTTTVGHYLNEYIRTEVDNNIDKVEASSKANDLRSVTSMSYRYDMISRIIKEREFGTGHRSKLNEKEKSYMPKDLLSFMEGNETDIHDPDPYAGSASSYRKKVKEFYNKIKGSDNSIDTKQVSELIKFFDDAKQFEGSPEDRDQNLKNWHDSTGGILNEEETDTFSSQFGIDENGKYFNKSLGAELASLGHLEVFNSDLGNKISDVIYDQHNNAQAEGQGNGTKDIVDKIKYPAGYKSLLENLKNPSAGDIAQESGLSSEVVEKILTSLISGHKGKPPKAADFFPKRGGSINDYLKIQQILNEKKTSPLYKITHPGFEVIRENINTLEYSLKLSNQYSKTDNEKSHELLIGADAEGKNANGTESANGMKRSIDAHFEAQAKSSGNEDSLRSRMFDGLQNKSTGFTGMDTPIGQQIAASMGLALTTSKGATYSNKDLNIMKIIKTIPQGVLLQAHFAILASGDPSKNAEQVQKVLMNHKGKPTISENEALHIAHSNLIMVNSSRTDVHDRKITIDSDRRLNESAEKIVGTNSNLTASEVREAILEFTNKQLHDISPKALTILSIPSIMDYLNEDENIDFLKKSDNSNVAFSNKMSDLRRSSENIDNMKARIEENPMAAKEYANKMNVVVPEDNAKKEKMRLDQKDDDEMFQICLDEGGKWRDSTIDNPKEELKDLQLMYAGISSGLRSDGSTSVGALNDAFKSPPLPIAGFMKSLAIGGFAGLKDIGATFATGVQKNGMNEMMNKGLLSVVKFAGAGAFNQFDSLKNNRFLKNILPKSWLDSFKEEETKKTEEQKLSIAAYSEMFEDIQNRKVATGALPDGKNVVDFKNMNAAYPNYYGDKVVNDYIAGEKSESFYLGSAIQSYNNNDTTSFTKGYRKSKGENPENAAWEGSNPLNLGALTSGAQIFMRGKVADNEESNKNIRRQMIASSVAEISPMSDKSNSSKDKVIDNIIEASSGDRPILELQDLQGILERLTGEPDQGLIDRTKIIQRLKEEKEGFLKRRQTTSRSVVLPTKVAGKEGSLNNVTLTLKAAGRFSLYGYDGDGNSKEIIGSTGELESDGSSDKKKEVSSILNTVRMTDVITAASNDPERLSHHIDFIENFGTAGPEQQIQSPELYRNILKNVYKADANDAMKQKFVEKVMKHSNVSKIDLAQQKEIAAQEKDAASEKIVEEREDGYIEKSGKFAGAAVKGTKDFFSSHFSRRKLEEYQVSLLKDFKLAEEQNKFEEARKIWEKLMDGANKDQQGELKRTTGQVDEERYANKATKGINMIK